MQLSLFKDQQHLSTKLKEDISEWGTFKDSLRAPVHRWFTYPAGFSYKAVQHTLKKFEVTHGQTIYDPFMGSGTTNLTAKTCGIHSYGVEAHPFVFRIAKAKLNWDIDAKSIFSIIDYV
jgi:DNA modification methylase